MNAAACAAGGTGWGHDGRREKPTASRLLQSLIGEDGNTDGRFPLMISCRPENPALECLRQSEAGKTGKSRRGPPLQESDWLKSERGSCLECVAVGRKVRGLCWSVGTASDGVQTSSSPSQRLPPPHAKSVTVRSSCGAAFHTDQTNVHFPVAGETAQRLSTYSSCRGCRIS